MGMPELTDEDRYGFWPRSNREDDAKQCAIKMGIMIDISSALSRHIDRIAQEKQRVNNCRDGKEENINSCPGLQ